MLWVRLVTRLDFHRRNRRTLCLPVELAVHDDVVGSKLQRATDEQFDAESVSVRPHSRPDGHGFEYCVVRLAVRRADRRFDGRGVGRERGGGLVSCARCGKVM